MFFFGRASWAIKPLAILSSLSIYSDSMSCQPLVSILIPAFNAEDYIGLTIESALSQLWPRKEVIVVDDGSSDATLDVARTYSSVPGFRVISQPNRGVSAARNAALSLAKGDYIQWLDADDLLDSNKISVQMGDGNSNLDAGILRTSAWGSFYYCKSRARFVPDDLWETLSPLEWLLRKFRKNLWMNPACWLVSRELTEATGLWDERLVRDNDGEYLCRLVCKCSEVRFVRTAKVYYRTGDLRSLSNNTSRASGESRALSIRLCVNHLLSIEDSQRTRTAALQFMQLRKSLWRDFPDLYKSQTDLARSLGGCLERPKERHLVQFVETLIGSRATERVRSGKRVLTNACFRACDAFWHHLRVP